MIEVIYTDRRGASCIRRFGDEIELERFVRKLRAEATIRVVETGERIGCVERNDLHTDDRRIKWLWHYDAVAVHDACSGARIPK